MIIEGIIIAFSAGNMIVNGGVAIASVIMIIASIAMIGVNVWTLKKNEF